MDKWIKNAVRNINWGAMNGDRNNWEMNQELAAEIIERHYRAATTTDKMRELNEECATLRKDCIRMGQAILWALGEHEEFPAREEGQGAYWWRSELRRRSGLRARAATKAETCPRCGSSDKTRRLVGTSFGNSPCPHEWHSPAPAPQTEKELK